MTSDKWRVTGKGKTLAVQDFERQAPRGCRGERRSPLGRTPFGPTQDRAHDARAQTADNAKSAGQSGGKIGVDLDSRVRGNDTMEAVRGKVSAVARTELSVIGIGSLALGQALGSLASLTAPVSRILLQRSRKGTMGRMYLPPFAFLVSL